MSDALVVDVREISKTFRDFWMRPKVKAVRNINFTIKQGEIFGLLGPNGAGKSTTIKMLLGLLFPDRGQISILGNHPRANAVKKFIGYMPEESYLYPYLSAEETLRFYGKIFGYSSKSLQIRVDSLLEMVGLKGASQRPIGEFSKGMARRIALAQALMNDPQLIILDEPTTGMDPLGNREFKELILHLKQKGKTIIICSHLLSDMQDLCDTVAIFYGGTIVSNGAVKDLLSPNQTLEDYFLSVVDDASAKFNTGGAKVGDLTNSIFEQSTANAKEASVPAEVDEVLETNDPNQDVIDELLGN